MIYIDDVQDDTDAVSLYAGDSAVTRTIELDCHDGHEFSLVSGAVAGCAVEFRQEDELSWHDLEAGAYDVSSFAGTRETFQIRYTPSAANEPQALQFRVGPA